jgi:nicotinate-nucleotide pyrophosphorylase (carboxylating)
MRESDFLPLIDLALLEDLGSLGDVTSKAITPDKPLTACLWSKDSGVLAGEEVFSAVFKRVDPRVSVEFHIHDGAELSKGDRVATVRGRMQSLLSAERTAIDFIAFMSGIATKSRRFASAAAASGKAVILDTRKTIPGLRALSKYAVSIGGCTNHRQGLYDMVLIKDNHIDSAGSVTAAIESARRMWRNRFTMETECRSLAEVKEALTAGADIVMLDNMSPAQCAEAVAAVNGRAKTEASGNMTLERIKEYAATGVDYISVGELTHTVAAFDFSLKAEKETSGG